MKLKLLKETEIAPGLKKKKGTVITTGERRGKELIANKEAEPLTKELKEPEPLKKEVK